ncbi:hypothetical protein ACJJTC_017376 [Scirpophaga incertulas]
MQLFPKLPSIIIMNYQDNQGILPPHLNDKVNRIIKKYNFKKYSMNINLLPTDSSSFLGILREVTIFGESDDGVNEINLFIKTSSPDQTLTIYSIPDSYNKEVFAYTDLLRVMQDIQDQFKLPEMERYNIVKGYDESDVESIIMENLCKKGYKTLDKFERISLKYAELAIKQLSRFHGISIVLREKRPNYFDEKIKSLKQPFYYGAPWNEFIDNINNLGISCLDTDVRDRVIKYLPTTYDKYEKYTTDSMSMKCLVHGDYRMNNIMAKFKGEELLNVAVIDYQLMFYGCPIIDFLYFIFGNTDQQFRKDHITYLKDIYHETMGQFLKYFDMDVEMHYPRKEFERLYVERLDYGLMISLWFIPITLANPGEIPDLTKVNLAELKFNLNDVVRSRVRGVVDDFLNWGYL